MMIEIKGKDISTYNKGNDEVWTTNNQRWKWEDEQQ